MDKEFLRFCYLIIGFFSQKSVQETAEELLLCLRCEMLLRDSNETIYRVLLKEAEFRHIRIYDYLQIIKENLAIDPDIVSVPIQGDITSSDLD